MYMKEKPMHTEKWRRIFVSARGARLGWILLLVVTLVILGEALVVDPAGHLMNSMGIRELQGIAPHSWTPLLHESVKRFLRVGVVCVAVWLGLRWSRTGRSGSLAYQFRKNRLQDLATGIGLGFLIQGLSVILMALTGWYRITGFAPNGPAILHALVHGTETAMVEEVLFRGLLVALVAARFGIHAAIWGSSILFGLLHFQGFEAAFPWWASIISAAAAAFVLAYAFIIRRSLWLPIGIHFAWHVAARILGSVGIARDEAICLATTVDGPMLLVNTKAGGAGGLELLGVALVALIIWQRQRDTLYT